MARIRKKTRTLRVRAFNAKVKSGQSEPLMASVISQVP